MSKTLVSCPGCQALVSPGGCCPLCGGSLLQAANPPGPESPVITSPPKAGISLAESGMDFLVEPPSWGESTPGNPATAGWAKRPPLPAGIADQAFPRVPGYDITAELGRGGMGVVYMARQVDLKRVVALKMILAGDFASPDDRARFKAEAESVARLQHPNIVQIYEIGEHDKKPYFSLEYVAGGSLHERLADGPQPPRSAAELICILAKGMHAAHLGGIVHRDLKPGNILLQPPGSQAASEFCSSHYGIPKITDFGLAKQLDVEAKTLSGTIMGTPQYMAPEQARGRVKEIGPWADIYALGAILYEMLTGRPPFQADSSMDTIMLVVTAEPLSPRQLQPKVPPDLETICLKCLEKDLAKRYASAADLAADLQRFLSDQPIVARPVGALERMQKWARRRPAVASLLAVVLAVALVGFSGILWQWREAVLARDDARTETIKTKAALAEKEITHYYRCVALAQREWQARNVGQARALLAQCPPELRDWEWRYLNRLCHAELAVILGSQPWLHVAYSPNGRYLAAGSMDGTVKIWNADNQQELANCRGHQGSAWRVAFSPDGKLLASGGDDKQVRIWEVPSGKLLETFPKYKVPEHKHVGPVRGLAFSPDGVKLASAGNNVIIWDVASGKTLAEYRPPAPTVRAVEGDLPAGGLSRVAFHPDGKQLAAVGNSYQVTILDLPTGKAATFKAHERAIFGVAYSPDGKWLATGSADLTVQVRDLTGTKKLLTFRGSQDSIGDISFSADSGRLAWASADETITIDDLDPGQPGLALRGHTGAVHGVSFHPDSRRVASAGDDSAIRVWDSRVDPEVQTIPNGSRVEALALAPGNRLLAAASYNGIVQVWERASLETVWIWLSEEMDRACALAISPDGRFLAAGGYCYQLDDLPGIVLVWDLKSGQQAQLLRLTEHPVSGLAFSPDGTLYGCTSPSGTSGNPERCPIVGWNIHTGQETVRIPGHPGGTAGLALSPDGRVLASAGNDRLVRLWDAKTGKEQATLAGHQDNVNAVTFHPSGQWLASGGDDHQIILWNLASGQPERTLKGHKKLVTCLAFSKNGQRFASGSDDTTVKLWDIATGQNVLTLTRHGDKVNSVAFSADGAWLASGGQDRNVLLWHAPE